MQSAENGKESNVRKTGEITVFPATSDKKTERKRKSYPSSHRPPTCPMKKRTAKDTARFSKGGFLPLGHLKKQKRFLKKQVVKSKKRQICQPFVTYLPLL